MRDLYSIYKNKKFDTNKLIEYGFIKEKNNYIYKETICDEQFEVVITISEKSAISKVIDLFDNEEYAMADIKESSGPFVGKIKEEYELCLEDIINNCTIPNVFKENQSLEVINYIKEKYNTELEFLWDDLDGAGVMRNKDNQKWYGILMQVKKSSLEKSTKDAIRKYITDSKIKLQLKSDNDEDTVYEVIDIRYDKEKTFEICDYKSIIPAYHMNKKSWITIVLDGSLPIEKIYELIDHSYDLVKPNSSGSYMIPANNNIFDIIGYFEEYDTITWHKTSKMKEGDFVYIYMGAPYSAIMFKLYASKVNNGRSGKKTITLKLLEKYDKDKYPLSFLREYGVNSVHFPRSLPESLAKKLA